MLVNTTKLNAILGTNVEKLYKPRYQLQLISIVKQQQIQKYKYYTKPWK